MLDATGRGSVSIGPAKYAEKWAVRRLTTRGTVSPQPSLYVYRGALGERLLDTSVAGNGDISETNIELSSGEHITAWYTGGSPGAIMVFYVEGVVRYGIR